MLSKTTKGLVPLSVVGALYRLRAACNRGGAGGGTSAEPKTEDDKVFYALGLDIGKNIDVFGLQPNEAELVKAGLSDAIAKRKPKVDLDVVRPKIFEMARKRQEAKAGGEKTKGKAVGRQGRQGGGRAAAALRPGHQELCGRAPAPAPPRTTPSRCTTKAA